jgi:hypothetical protein
MKILMAMVVVVMLAVCFVATSWGEECYEPCRGDETEIIVQTTKGIQQFCGCKYVFETHGSRDVLRIVCKDEDSSTRYYFFPENLVSVKITPSKGQNWPK